MTQTKRTLTLLLDHPGFPTLAEQRSACQTLKPADGGAHNTCTEQIITAPDTHRWQQILGSALADLPPGDIVCVQSLSVLAPSANDLLQNLATLAGRQALLLTSETVGIRARGELLTSAALLRDAAQQSQDQQTSAELAAPSPARGVTPPHARAVAIASYRRVTAEA